MTSAHLKRVAIQYLQNKFSTRSQAVARIADRIASQQTI